MGLCHYPSLFELSQNLFCSADNAVDELFDGVYVFDHTRSQRMQSAARSW